ncbi:MAG TPA: molybdate ABC transporter substrate-binding protein [Candidatus Dormibacteraeota bacterium]
MRRVFGLLLAGLLLVSCGTTASTGDSPSPGYSGSITVLAAASLTGAFTKIGADFQSQHPGTSVKFSFAGSSTLATQIQQGAPADVFASADQQNMKKIVDGALNQGTPQTFARNRLEIVVHAGNPKGINGLSDLAAPGLIVVLCAPAVPCGRYGGQALQTAGVSVKPASLETDVKAVISKVALGEADAGIVYVTDVKAGGSSVQGVVIPDSQNVIASYPIAILKDSQNLPLAKAFVAYVLENVEAHRGGQLTLRQFGFLGP